MVSRLPALVPGIDNSQEIKELTENFDMLMKDLERTEKRCEYKHEICRFTRNKDFRFSHERKKYCQRLKDIRQI
jgi:hypothetical protein